MLKLNNNQKLTAAIERARKSRQHVRWLGERTFEVLSDSGNTYTVRFAVVGALKLGECDCAAGQRGQLCKHIPAAAALNIGIQSARRGQSLALAA